MTSRYDTEFLKNYLTRQDSTFYTRAPKTPGATYRVLFAHLKPTYLSSRRSCKVDILIPGILGIPKVPAERVRTIAGLPVMPMVPQLLLKVQGWSDHRASHRQDMQLKQYVDVGDIDELLAIAVAEGADVRAPENKWLPGSMTGVAPTRIWSYTLRGSAKSKEQWKAIGFEIP